MTLVKALEDLADDTWERLRDSETLEVRFGEETVTDLVLLELKRSCVPGIAVLQTNKKAESTQGTDWEWWIGSNNTGWVRFAVQAKKLDLSSKRYDALGHKVSGRPQIDLLLKFAAKHQAIPLYCLFNFVSPVDTKESWHCCEGPVVSQLACTVTPAAIVRHAIDTRGCRTFEWIHSHPSTLPWRCLVKCPRFQNLFNPAASLESRTAGASELLGGTIKIFPGLPPEIEAGRREGRVPEFSERFYSPEEEGQPRRVVVLDRSANGAV
jgi:hypothetical protein